MGNLDLIIIVNKEAFVIKGEEYTSKQNAIFIAIDKFQAYQQSIDKSRYDENGELYEHADTDWYPEEVESIQIFYKTS